MTPEQADRVGEALRGAARHRGVDVVDGDEATVARWVGGDGRPCLAAVWKPDGDGAVPLVCVSVSAVDRTGVAVLRAVLAAVDGEERRDG